MRESAGDALEDIYRMHGRAALATLIRLLGDFDLAERRWARRGNRRSNNGRAKGMPSNPWAWLVLPAVSRRSTACAGARASKLSDFTYRTGLYPKCSGGG
jgi:predicted RNA polymerase sigma factor